MIKRVFQILLLLLVAACELSGQGDYEINDSLNTICSKIQCVDFDAGPNYGPTLRSHGYNLQVIDDSLVVKLSENLKDKNPDRNGKYHSIKSHSVTKAHLKDINEIIYINDLIETSFGSYHDSKIDIMCINDERLFHKTVEDTFTYKAWHIPIPVVRHSDSTQFRLLYELLNDYIKPESNSKEPSCKVDDRHGLSGAIVNAVDNNNFEKPIQLNDANCTNGSIELLLKQYLSEENIKGLYGYFVLDSESEIIELWCEQFNLYNYVNKLDTLPTGYKTIIKSMGLIDEDQYNAILNELKNQKWSSGQCKGIKLNSYFDFQIKNPDYKEILGEKK